MKEYKHNKFLNAEIIKSDYCGWCPTYEYHKQKMDEIKEKEGGDKIEIKDNIISDFDMNKYILKNEPMRCNLFLIELPEIENLNYEDIVSFKDISYKPKGLFKKRNKDAVKITVREKVPADIFSECLAKLGKVISYNVYYMDKTLNIIREEKHKGKLIEVKRTPLEYGNDLPLTFDISIIPSC